MIHHLPRPVRHAVHEVQHLRELRTLVLCAELRIKGIPYQRRCDAVTVRVDRLWYDLYAWVRDDGLVWVVDHPHTDPDDAYPGHEIGRLKGFRIDLEQVFHLWFQYRRRPDYYRPCPVRE